MSQPKIEIEDTSDEDIDIEIEEATDEEIDIEIEESTEDEPNIEIEDYEEYTDYDSYEKLSLDETSSSSTLTEELKKLGDDVFKGEKYKRYEESLKENIPVTFILTVKNEVINMKKMFNKSKGIVENYNIFIDKGLKIEPTDFILLFYIVNKDKSKKYLIENFNKLRELAGVEEYFIEAFDDYKYGFEQVIKFRMDSVKTNFDLLKKFYSEIESFKTTDKYSDVLDTFSEDIKKSTFKIKDGEYFFDNENTKIIFNNIKVNPFFSYVRLDDNNQSLYKIYTGGNKKYINFIDYNSEIPFEKNKLYLYYELAVRNKSMVNHIKLDFDTSKCEINYYGNTIDDILSRIKELLPEIKIYDKEDTELSGDFEITMDNFNETKLYYLTLFDSIFQEFIYIREDSSLRSLKENIKYYFVGSDQTREYLNYSSFFYIRKLYNNRYLIKYTSKSTSSRMIKEFILILIKLFWYYNNLPQDILTYLSMIEKPYTGVNGEGLGGDEKDLIELSVSGKTRKIENLQKIDQDLFQKRLYVRNCPCQQQPVAIAKEDKQDWENYQVDGKKRNVVIFPPEKSSQKVSKNYYVCTDDKFSTFSLRENPDSSSLYPLIPCCNISNFPQDLYDDYDKIRENPSKYWSSKEKYRGKSIGILKTLKILAPGRKGILMDFVVNFLSKVEKKDYIREGAKSKSKSSFLHCIFRCIKDYNIGQLKDIPNYISIRKLIEKYSQSKEETKEYAVISFRNYIEGFKNFVGLEVCLQELYDHSIPEIVQLLANPNINLDSNKFYRFFEIFFSINIFVFVFDKENNNTYLETPNHQYYHIRIVNDKLPCLFLVKHKRKYSFDIYEIVRRKDDKEPYLFSPKFSKYMKQYIFDNNIYYIKTGDVLRKNCYNILNWDVLLKDYIFIHQNINSSGRMFSFSFQASKDKKDLVSVFTESSPPLYCGTSDEIYFTTKKRCIKLFGDKYTVGSRGLWYPVNDIKEGFFIPCDDIKEKREFVCKNFEIILGKDRKNRELENIEICKHNSNIYIQLIKWLYLLENIEINKWFSKNVIEDSKMTPDSLVSQYFNLPLRFPQNIKTTREGIIYLGEHAPNIFDSKSGKIYLYPELYHSTMRNITNFLKSNQDIIIPNMKTIHGTLEFENDFENYTFNKILIANDFNYWSDNIIKENKVVTRVEDDFVNYKIPFVLKNQTTGKIYMVQNTVESSLTVSIVIAKIYQMFDNGTDYKTTIKNLWSSIKTYYNRYDFGWSFEKLKLYINSKLDRETYFKNSQECLDFLIKNKISFTLEDKFSYIVYGKVNDKMSITRKYIIDDSIPLELYGFSSGAYASMLPII